MTVLEKPKKVEIFDFVDGEVLRKRHARYVIDGKTPTMDIFCFNREYMPEILSRYYEPCEDPRFDNIKERVEKGEMPDFEEDYKTKSKRELVFYWMFGPRWEVIEQLGYFENKWYRMSIEKAREINNLIFKNNWKRENDENSIEMMRSVCDTIIKDFEEQYGEDKDKLVIWSSLVFMQVFGFHSLLEESCDETSRFVYVNM